MATERLDKILASQGIGSRSEVKKLIKSGRVAVDGALQANAEAKVDPVTQTISVDGKEVGYKVHLYIMLNKPPGILCVSNDPKRQTVIDLLPKNLQRPGLFPAGRLDKDTEGFVLITDDGDFAHKLTSPKSGTDKTYEAVLDGTVTEEMIAQFAQGVTLQDGTKCLPAKLKILPNSEHPVAEIIICEGKYHQIKRMFGAVGLGVCGLKRIKIGQVRLDENLAPAACRELTEEEIVKIHYS